MAKIKNSGTIINTDYQFAKLIDGSITKADIPLNISSIRANAFNGCGNLLSVSIPQNVKSIGTSAFQACDNLKNLTFEDNGVISIGQNAFSGCAVEELRFPTGLNSLGGGAFQNCAALRKVSIPSTATSLGYASIGNNSNLTYVFFRGNTDIKNNNTNEIVGNCKNIRLFDMRYMETAKDKSTSATQFAVNDYIYLNVPDNLYNEFTALPNWGTITLKRWVHSCDVASFEDIQNPIDGDYYSLKGDTNYLNPLGEKQIDIRQYVGGQWVEVDIG